MKKILLIFCVLAVIVFTGCGGNETFVIKEINLEMVKCPEGSFMMGSPNEELGRNKLEILHLVTLTKPFYIGKYEVTQSQYIALMDKNPSRFVAANNPVDSVLYNEAKDFCDKLNLKYLNQLPQGYKFDLPTEAQWEYACRAGTNTALNNGKNLTNSSGTCPNLDEVAWYEENSNKTTHPVGLKKPNAWGLYDMHGNVEELCKDWYDTFYYVKCGECSNPKGPDTGYSYVRRGGSWYSLFGPRDYRSGCRSDTSPTVRSSSLGFRLALVPVE